jgi:hypothetical protein
MRAAAVAIALALCSRSAAADPAAATARAYYLAGQAAYKAGDFAAAALALEQANQALPDPATMFSLGQAYRQLYVATHDPAYAARAVELYQSYLREVPRDGRSEDAREFVASLDTLLELAKYHGAVTARSIAPKTQLMVWSSVPGARAAIDGGAMSTLPIVVDTAAGEHAVELVAPGYESAHLDVAAVDGRLVPVEGRLEPKPATLHVTAAADARILVDEVDVANTDHGIVVPPGHHRLWLGRRGHDVVQREVEVAPGGSETVTVVFVDSVQRHRARWTLAGGAALGATALGAFTYAAISAHHASDLLAVRDAHAWTLAQSADYASSRDAALSWRAVSIGLALGAAVVTGVGAYLYYSDVPDAPRRSVLTPLVGSKTVGVAVTAGF